MVIYFKKKVAIDIQSDTMIINDGINDVTTHVRKMQVSIKQLMKQAGITLGDVATASGCSRPDVCRILDDGLNAKIRATALRLIQERNLSVQNQLAELQA